MEKCRKSDLQGAYLYHALLFFAYANKLLFSFLP